MFEFFKRKKETLSMGNVDLENSAQLAKVDEVVETAESDEIAKTIESDIKDESVEETVKAKSMEQDKFIIKEEAKIMSIPCDHKNYLPQTLLKIDKTLITNPNDVAIHVNLGHLDSVDTIEEGIKEIIEIADPCGGPGTIQGEALLEKVILIGGVHYSIVLFDNTTKTKIYDGQIESLTAYTLYKIMPFGVEVEVDPTKVSASFTTSLTKLDDIPGVDYHLYTVDGEVELVVNP